MFPAEPVWIALVTFERTDGSTDILPSRALGTCGWMGVAAEHEHQLEELFRKSLNADGLKLIELQDVTPISSADEAEEFDEHLAFNMRNWEQGKRTVWGTLHIYLDAGEA